LHSLQPTLSPESSDIGELATRALISCQRSVVKEGHNLIVVPSSSEHFLERALLSGSEFCHQLHTASNYPIIPNDSQDVNC
jgi:hypothetical protein